MNFIYENINHHSLSNYIQLYSVMCIICDHNNGCLSGLNVLRNAIHINLHGCSFVTSVPTIKNLRILNCDGCKNLRVIAPQPSLKYLSIASTSILGLPTFYKLKYLDLGTNSSMTKIKFAPNFKYLFKSPNSPLEIPSDKKFEVFMTNEVKPIDKCNIFNGGAHKPNGEILCTYNWGNNCDYYYHFHRMEHLIRTDELVNKFEENNCEEISTHSLISSLTKSFSNMFTSSASTPTPTLSNVVVSGYKGKNFNPDYKKPEVSSTTDNVSGYKGKNFNPDYKKPAVSSTPTENATNGYKGKNFNPNYKK